MTEEEIKMVAQEYARKEYYASGVNPNLIERLIIDILSKYCT